MDRGLGISTKLHFFHHYPCITILVFILHFLHHYQNKNRLNIEKHFIDFNDAKEIFNDGCRLEYMAHKNSPLFRLDLTGYITRPQIHKEDKKEIAYREVMENEKSIKEMAESLGMSRMTIYRYIEKKQQNA